MVVYGAEPAYKDANHIAMNILANGTVLSRSAGNYLLVNKEGIPFNDVNFVDVPMTEAEM